MNTSSEKSEISRLIEIVENLNSRIAAIEAALPVEPETPAPELKKEKESSEDMEFRLGEQWFGKIGVVAFLFAVFYLLTFSFENPVQVLIMLAGYFSGAVLIGASFMKKEQMKSLAGYMTGSGLIIVYFSTLKLHYFTADPIIINQGIIIPLCFIICIAGVFIALKKNSPALTVIAFVLPGITALLADSMWVIAPVLIILSAGSVIIEKRYKWENLSLFIIPVIYILFFLWFINNPLTGREILARQDISFTVLIIPLLMGIFGFSQIENREPDGYYSVLKAILNTAAGYLLFIYITLNGNLVYPAIFNFVVSLLLLSVAARHWILQRSKICTFLYSMAGYGALSFAIILKFDAPESYILLCWQSLLVVSTALWFRSRFIVVANFFIFFFLLGAYIITGSELNIQSLSFGLIALISARLINIHKLRLELQSEQLRNAYLVIAVLFIPFVLYSLLPTAVVGITWITLAFIYYVIGKLINNKKYRLMASATLMMALVYIFIFGLTSSDILYKILSFLLVSIALVIISIVYARVRTKEMDKPGS